MKYPPIIILGMHRSGTTMLSKLLEQFGLFVGSKKEENDESLFFYKINEWLLRQANASWDNPRNFNFINDEFKKKVIKALEFHLKGFRRYEYLGLKKFLKYKDIRNLDFPWGWKDPRNTFTIDLWKEIFPDAKLLHIYRNPIDVAESLRKREGEIQKTFRKNWRETAKELLLIGKVGYQSSLRLQNVHEGIQLWQEYIDKAFSLNGEFKENILHIRYETFLENPETTLQRILEFIDIQVEKSGILAAAQMVKSDRKFAFIKDTGLIEIYRQIKEKDIMKKLSYHNILD
ncbi:MAG: sulfotransferase [Candidatus Brocadiales bacterium]|nr:sulfotransferase [Candidatus Brocadiales bacterium]